MQWLDKLLEKAVTAAQIAYGSAAADDPYRGLHLTQEDVEQLLNREPGVPQFQMDAESEEYGLSKLVSDRSPLFWLQQTFGLSLFDLQIVAIALAPEIDRRYERLYAYLQDNVTYNLPSVDLALNLLCRSGAAKLIRRDRFAPDAPLLRHHHIRVLWQTRQHSPDGSHAIPQLAFVHTLYRPRGLSFKEAHQPLRSVRSPREEYCFSKWYNRFDPHRNQGSQAVGTINQLLIVSETAPSKYCERQAFRQLPIEERRRILTQQAEAMKEYYQEDEHMSIASYLWYDTGLLQQRGGFLGHHLPLNLQWYVLL